MLRQRLQLPQWTELLCLLVVKDLRIRYKRSILGYFWAIANPFMFALVYWIAFKLIMHIQIEDYSVFIITGLFPWTCLNQSISQATGSYTNGVSLVRRVKLPKLILPLSNVLQEMVHFAFAIPVVFFFIFVGGGSIHASEQAWQIPLMLLVQAAFIYPLAVLCALFNVFLRDVQHLVGIFFSLLFFATPIVYSIAMVPGKYLHYFQANPVFSLVECWRGVFIDGVISFSYVAHLLIWAAALSVIAALVYRRLSGKIAELV